MVNLDELRERMNDLVNERKLKGRKGKGKDRKERKIEWTKV